MNGLFSGFLLGSPGLSSLLHLEGFLTFLVACSLISSKTDLYYYFNLSFCES